MRASGAADNSRMQRAVAVSQQNTLSFRDQEEFLGSFLTDRAMERWFCVLPFYISCGRQRALGTSVLCSCARDSARFHVVVRIT
jgi:hypothetical protein